MCKIKLIYMESICFQRNLLKFFPHKKKKYCTDLSIPSVHVYCEGQFQLFHFPSWIRKLTSKSLIADEGTKKIETGNFSLYGL